MSWLSFFNRRASGASKSHSRARRNAASLRLEALEDRVVPATADLIAYRPVTDYFDYASYAVLNSQEESFTLGAGIRINGDDDNGNGVADYADSGPTGADDNDLVRVDLAASGTSTTLTLTFTSNLKVWSTAAKDQEILSGASVWAASVWVEFVSTSHTTGSASAVLTLTVSDATSSATDKVVFHSFKSVVIAIGGYSQDPASVGDPTLGVFTIATKLYQQGYDVHMYAHDQVSSSGAGAAYNEVVAAVTWRNVDYVAIYGFSWGGGATYELAKGLQANASIQGQYTLPYTAYIDAITHNSIGSERRLPAASQYHDNIYQRRDWLLRGNSVSGANNLNVTNTSWGKKLLHTTIDDNATVQGIIVTNLTSRVVG